MSAKTVPPHILFGISSCSYQTEGHNIHSDWYHFEEQMFYGDADHTCGECIDHWRRWPQDHKYLTELGVNVYRTSMEWSRIEPKNGKFDTQAISEYRRLLTDLKKKKIKTVITLFHYVSPHWFSELGGFAKKENLQYYDRYQQKILDELGDLIDILTPVNEIFVYASLAYMIEHFPPNQKNMFTALQVVRNLIRAHFMTAAACKEKKKEIKIASAEQIRFLYSGNNNLFTRLVCRFLNYLSGKAITASLVHNRFFFPFGIGGTIYKGSYRPLDYVGIQFYPSVPVHFTVGKKGLQFEPVEHNGDWVKALMNSEIHAADFYKALEMMKQFKKPLLITEFGVQSENDEKRSIVLKKIVNTLSIAAKNGYTIIGFLYFTLFDCFEWTQGFTQKFGLIGINRKKRLARNIKNSFYTYKHIINKFAL